MNKEKPTRFLEELCQDVIIRLLLALRLRLLPPVGPFLQQVRDAVALEAGVAAVFAFLTFAGVRGVAVLPFFHAFLGARRSGARGFNVALCRLQFIDAILVHALIALRGLVELEDISIP